MKQNKMERILRKKYIIFVKKIKVGDLDKDKLSNKFKSHNFDDDMIVNVKCNSDGSFDLRGNDQEYRIIVED